MIFNTTIAASKNKSLEKILSYDYAQDVVLVFDGNSLTQGTIGDATLSQYYPIRVKNYFEARFNSVVFYSYGVNGKKISQMNDGYVVNISDKPVLGKTNFLIGWEDINSFLDLTALQHWDQMVSYFQKAKDNGFQHTILITGYHPRQHSYTATLIQRRKDFIQMVKDTPISDVPWDYHIDLNKAFYIGGAEGLLRNAYFHDEVHLNMIGYNVVADWVIRQIKDIVRL